MAESNWEEVQPQLKHPREPPWRLLLRLLVNSASTPTATALAENLGQVL